MKQEELKKRFKNWALMVIVFTRKFPTNAPELKDIRSQIIRSVTSAAANYRAACRAKSAADFINKLKIVEEETDETQFWIELLIGLFPEWRSDVGALYKEGDELLAIVVASIKTSKAKENERYPNRKS